MERIAVWRQCRLCRLPGCNSHSDSTRCRWQIVRVVCRGLPRCASFQFLARTRPAWAFATTATTAPACPRIQLPDYKQQQFPYSERREKEQFSSPFVRSSEAKETYRWFRAIIEVPENFHVLVLEFPEARIQNEYQTIICRLRRVLVWIIYLWICLPWTRMKNVKTLNPANSVTNIVVACSRTVGYDGEPERRRWRDSPSAVFLPRPLLLQFE